MKERRVRFTATAAQQIDSERSWWLENRDHLELFTTQLEQAVKILATLPGAGTPYRHSATPTLRRFYLKGIACHVYYTFDDEEVIVRALWGAHRARGPIVG